MGERRTLGALCGCTIVNKYGFYRIEHCSRHGACDALYKAAKEALEDLRTWHTEAFAYTHPQGYIEYGMCDGCDTCAVTIPMLENAIADADKAMNAA